MSGHHYAELPEPEATGFSEHGPWANNMGLQGIKEDTFEGYYSYENEGKFNNNGAGATPGSTWDFNKTTPTMACAYDSSQRQQPGHYNQRSRPPKNSIDTNKPRRIRRTRHLSAVLHQLPSAPEEPTVPDVFAFAFRRTRPTLRTAAEEEAYNRARLQAQQRPRAQLIPTGQGYGELPINAYDMASGLMTRLDPNHMPPSEWGHVVNTAISGHLPHGVAVTPSKERATRDPEHLWLLGRHKDMTEEQRNKVQAFLLEQKELKAFAYSLNDFEGGYTGEPAYFQPLDPSKTAFTKPRSYSPLQKEVITAKKRELLEAGLIEPAPHSQSASAVTIAAQKDAEGNWSQFRMCGDYRRINDILAPQHTRTAVADELFRQVDNCRYVSKLDLKSGFLQIPVRADCKHYTSLWFDHDLYQYKYMPFGFKQAPAIFQKVMDTVLQALPYCTKCYIDDVLVHSASWEQHMIDLADTFAALRKVNLKIHAEKTIICTDSVEFLGFDISEAGITPQEAKVEALRVIPEPANLEQLRTALGQLRYYGCFVPGFSGIARPMLDLLKKDADYKWTPECSKAFKQIKDMIAEPGRALRRFETDRPTFIHCDFSNVGLGAVLSQVDADGNEYMVACISRSLNKAEKNYSSYKGECLAAVWACKMFQTYTQGLHFTLVTDHEPLKWLMANNHLTGAHARWACILQEHDFTIMHRPGAQSANVDALSRFPRASTEDRSGARFDEDTEAEVTRIVAALTSRTVFESEWLHPIKTYGPPDTYGIKATQELDTQPRKRQWQAAATTGVTLYEPFGGLCAGLEAVLRNGVPVQHYYYSDVNPAAQLVAKHRITQLHLQYPRLFPVAASAHAFDTIAQDVFQVTTAQLISAGAREDKQWLIIAGPECQDFSPAGGNRGYDGKHSRTLQQCINIIGALQQLRATLHEDTLQTLYVIENAAMQYNFKSQNIREDDYRKVCSQIGQPVTIDAARFDSYAHRLRNFWTNLAHPIDLNVRVAAVRRTPGIRAQHILDGGRICAEVHRSDTPPFYPANVLGQPRSTLPTLVAYPMSRAFHQGCPGAIWQEPIQGRGDIRPQPGRWTEPNPEERERALGYPTGATAAPGVSPQDRHKITGNCMDQAAISGLLRCSLETALNVTTLSQMQYKPVHQHVATYCCPTLPSPTQDPPDNYSTHLAPEVLRLMRCPPHLAAIMSVAITGGENEADAVDTDDAHAIFLRNKRLNRMARERAEKLDIHQDEPTLYFLKNQVFHPDTKTPAQIKRVTRRAKGYEVKGDLILRIQQGGYKRVVPKPGDRVKVIQEAHTATGHWGYRRTANLLMANYWWSSLIKDTQRLVSECDLCRRVSTAFNVKPNLLRPLEIKGLFYRWSVDLAGPLADTTYGNKYAMIMVEHYSRSLVLAAIPVKEARYTRYAFEQSVLARFGSPAEVLTDGGSEWMGTFEDMLSSLFIDHRTTSANHPQANGLAERCVQTVKRCLRRFCVEKGNLPKWDEQLAYIALGYNCSKQSSTGFAPFELLYARQPMVPAVVRERMREPLRFEEESPTYTKQLEEELIARAGFVSRAMPTVANHLAIAQHRDTLRYAMTRSGAFKPMVRKFSPGDYVYLRKANKVNTLDMQAKQTILRVLEARDDGTVLLQGRCGCSTVGNVINLAPCHLPNIDGTLDPTLARPAKDAACEVCNMPDDERLMMLCDACSTLWHCYCLPEPIDRPLPKGVVFVCPYCATSGVTPDIIYAKQSNKTPSAARQAAADMIRKSAKLVRLKSYDGRHILRSITRKGKAIPVWGVASFRGGDLPKPFLITYPGGALPEEHITLAELIRRKPLPKGTAPPSTNPTPNPSPCPAGTLAHRRAGVAPVEEAPAQDRRYPRRPRPT